MISEKKFRMGQRRTNDEWSFFYLYYRDKKYYESVVFMLQKIIKLHTEIKLKNSQKWRRFLTPDRNYKVAQMSELLWDLRDFTCFFNSNKLKVKVFSTLCPKVCIAIMSMNFHLGLHGLYASVCVVRVCKTNPPKRKKKYHLCFYI